MAGKIMKNIKEIKNEFENVELEQVHTLLKLYEDDTRAGVRKICTSFSKKYQKLQDEKCRLEKMCEEEKSLSEGLIIAGIDEAGRGPLAGPVVASAVIMPKDSRILYINDSKKLSQAKREALYDQIMAEAISVGVGIVSPEIIDEINILQATYVAMRQAVSQLTTRPELLLNDAVIIPELTIAQKGLIKGDARCYSIACASIIAKVTRDRMMADYDKIYPDYGFKENKGYGSGNHIEVLKKLGPCPIHRRSFIGNFIN
ncbi:Ribonuclease HII [Lachnospiraceae bacterium TWA4]|nr:Ribonuclease HII [Lachnospiraceae bacterium TWA4]